MLQGTSIVYLTSAVALAIAKIEFKCQTFGLTYGSLLQ